MTDRITRSRCVDPHTRIDQVINVVEEFVAGTPYTAGDAIDATQLASQVIDVKYDNTTISLNGSGELQAITASALTAGCGIDITAGVVSAAVDGTSIDCVGGNLTVIAYAFGKIVVSGWPDVDANQVVDTLTLVAGANMTISTSGDTITLASSYVDTDTTYSAGAGIDLDGTELRADLYTVSHIDFVNPLTGEASTIDDAAAQLAIKWNDIENYDADPNLILGHFNTDVWPPGVSYQTVPVWLQTLEDYEVLDRMVIGNDPDGTGVENDQNVKWIASPQKVIWGIDPNGGHTIATVGTTMTVTLKALKHTFDAVNWVSSVAEDIEITYTGTECP